MTDNETMGRLLAWVQTTDLQPTMGIQNFMRHARAAGFSVSQRRASDFYEMWRAFGGAQNCECAPCRCSCVRCSSRQCPGLGQELTVP